MDWSTENQDPDKILNTISQKCLEVCRKYVPRKKVAAKTNIIPRDRRILMKKCYKLRRKLAVARHNTTQDKIKGQITEIEKKLKQSIEDQQVQDESRPSPI